MYSKLEIHALALVVSVIFAQPAHAIVAGNAPTRDEVYQQYQAIVDRNPFGLKPPPPPVTNAPPPVEPPATKVEIFLTGITSVVKPKKVYLKSVEANPKDPKQKENFYSLTEGQAKDGIEILEINDRKREVRIRTGAEEKTLTFAMNGIKPPAGPPPPGILGVAAPGMPGMPAPGQPQMGGNLNPSFQPQPGVIHNQPGVNTYTPTTPIRSIPSRPTRTDAGVGLNTGAITPQPLGGAPAAATPAAPQISPEEQYLIIKANQEIARRAHQKGLAPEPPPVPDFHLQ